MSARNKPAVKKFRRTIRTANKHTFGVQYRMTRLFVAMSRAAGHQIVQQPNRGLRRGNVVAARGERRMA